MKKIITILSVFPILLWFAMPVALAGDSAIGSIIKVAMNLNHYPGNSEKQTLTNIIHNDDATAGEKALAGALIRMQHSVQGGDIATLRALASNGDASRHEQQLAEILLGLNHQASANDKQRLQSLAQSMDGSP